MAITEIANLANKKLEFINLSNDVGVGEKNDKNDVMLIQALFIIIGYNNALAKAHFGLTADDLPEPTGDFDEKTRKAIWAFQKTMRHRLLNIDGKIHKASYKDRVIRKPAGRLMTITLLHMLASDEAKPGYNADILSALKMVASDLVLIPVT